LVDEVFNGVIRSRTVNGEGNSFGTRSRAKGRGLTHNEAIYFVFHTASAQPIQKSPAIGRAFAGLLCCFLGQGLFFCLEHKAFFLAKNDAVLLHLSYDGRQAEGIVLCFNLSLGHTCLM
jgi:hypothetical protein